MSNPEVVEVVPAQDHAQSKVDYTLSSDKLDMVSQD